MKKSITFILSFVVLAMAPLVVSAREQIRAVGSSTVYPFVTVVAEEFGRKTRFKTPVVESTGTGGGFKLFCSGAGEEYPDISNASRAIKESEVALCKSNGVNNILEVKLGYDGIVLANAFDAHQYSLTKEQLFNAVARKVPSAGKLIDNPYQYWSDIDITLPKKKIEVYGPPPTSGTRDAFVELVLQHVCVNNEVFKKEYPDEKQRIHACHLVREDGAFIEAGENDNLIVQKLKANPDALGLFGYSFLDQNTNIVQASFIDGVEPTFETIANGSYGISRPLFVYVKKDHFDVVPGLKEFAYELVSDEAAGEDGYLGFKGLIPLSEEERKEVLDQIQ